MPRAGKTTGAPSTRLPQRVALGVLMRSFPPDQVDLVLDAAGRREQRRRLLPAQLMVYFTFGMWIFGALSYEDILSEILWDAPGLTRPPSREPASAAAIGRARRRLGVEPLRLLFEQAGALASAVGAEVGHPAGLPWRRVTRLTGIAVDVPDTPANRVEFGGGPDLHPVPQPPHAHMSLLIDDATQRIAAAQVGAEPDLVSGGLTAGAVSAGTLLVVDDRPFSAPLWAAVERLGAEQLWPLGERTRLAARVRLSDGSELCRLAAAGEVTGRTVRVIHREADGASAPAAGNGAAGQRAADAASGDGAAPHPGGTPAPEASGPLVTSVLDHRAVPARTLLNAHDRRRTRGVGKGYGFGGIEAYRSGERLVLRSKDPDLVRQELYAMLCVHHAIGELVDYTLPTRSTAAQPAAPTAPGAWPQ